MSGYIRLKGVRQNNLKGFDIGIPLGRLTVVTGLSGSGKSSFVLETLHAQGQYCYVETFSAYTRQFLDRLDKPQVDSVENIRPSIAIEQTNTIRNSRSTVGTMTELCDYMRVWFATASQLYDPQTGKVVEPQHPQALWRRILASRKGKKVLLAFEVHRPQGWSWESLLGPLMRQGYTRGVFLKTGENAENVVRLEGFSPDLDCHALWVIQDRLTVEAAQQARFLEAAQKAFQFGQGALLLLDEAGALDERFFEHPRLSNGLPAPKATGGLFSFNSPLGACSHCQGFGRVSEVDEQLLVPDARLSLEEGALKVFHGAVYSRCQRDLLEACRKYRIPVSIPWDHLSVKAKAFVLEGEPGYHEDVDPEDSHQWYGVKRFFNWLETKRYKTHVRVFLSRYKTYAPCAQCHGARLRPEALLFKWEGYTLPQLYGLPIDVVEPLLASKLGEAHEAPITQGILTRLGYLRQVGLGYLTLDRPSRTLSGGEVQRVNLTTCLGTSLVDTLFVLDEPSVGLHARDIDRLIGILRRLTALGNTVVVVEHDEALMRAADHLIEIGPGAGMAGGQVTFEGSYAALLQCQDSLTGRYLSGTQTVPLPAQRRPVTLRPWSCFLSGPVLGRTQEAFLHIRNAHKYTLKDFSLDIPLRRMVCLSGVSGSGKSTLLQSVLYQGWQAAQGKAAEDPAHIESITSDIAIDEVTLIDQSPVSRTPRSNPALFSGAWEGIREAFAMTTQARESGLTASSFSFNSAEGCCDHCQGLGYEVVPMQFLSDIYVECPVCEGKRFKAEVLKITYEDHTVDALLNTDVHTAIAVFKKLPKVRSRLENLEAVGLGYLKLGQPLNTLSGGECQRLKLVKYLSQLHEGPGHALILLDEPTTGLHRHDIAKLITVLQKLVDKGHSLILIEHQMDVLLAADWLIELGPEAGVGGGQCIAQGTPEFMAQAGTQTAPFLAKALEGEGKGKEKGEGLKGKGPRGFIPLDPLQGATYENALHFNKSHPSEGIQGPSRSLRDYTHWEAAEPPVAFEVLAEPPDIQIIGAREHNLKNISLTIKRQTLTVLTGISGSGKSTIADNILFAEGQRRFLESMSSYARQFVEQLPKPDVDQIIGIAPTVAIEQRITSGTQKSTVATVTEVAQYLRLLYARVGVQHSPVTGEPIQGHSAQVLLKQLLAALAQPVAQQAALIYLCAPMIRGRKGHHEPFAKWAQKQGYKLLLCDGQWVPVLGFQKLDRYQEHDLSVVVSELSRHTDDLRYCEQALKQALTLGKGACFLMSNEGATLGWFSHKNTDPVTGAAFTELDPKDFSWNSPRGWCVRCTGHGVVEEGTVCPECQGARLNPRICAVKLFFKNGPALSLPQLLSLSPVLLLEALAQIKTDRRIEPILASILPQIKERLSFMQQVGLDYLSMDRATSTLSGGEAQRIRLASQIGSELSGVLYILDEPSIGLHAQDNERLIASLKALRDKGNTVLVVEHDEAIIRAADCIIDLGPGAGRYGCEILAQGPWETIVKSKRSLTGKYLKEGIQHPLRGAYRPLSQELDWMHFHGVCFRSLKDIDLNIPKERLTLVCGASGSGKSTLVCEVVQNALLKAKADKTEALSGDALLKAYPYFQKKPFVSAEGLLGFNTIIEVDQSPIGKTPRSTPATYISAFDIIREVFALLPESKIQGFSASTFSFNTKGGRCETCQGAGCIRLEMTFLPDAYMTCEACQGRRFGPNLEAVQWQGHSIAAILQMSFDQAATFFSFHSRLGDLCRLMVETGLGYLTLGQSSPTLSGGEAQRLKLVSELAKGLPSFRAKTRGQMPKNCYLLEEPTIGLHISDCHRLIELLHRLVDQGHTVIVIEHNLDLIAEADYVVELGPKGGHLGGLCLYQGALEGLKGTPTAPYLRSVLKG